MMLQTEKSCDPHFRLMILPDAGYGAAPSRRRDPTNGKIGTRLRKSDKKATGALVDAQEESCPRGYKRFPLTSTTLRQQKYGSSEWHN
jgi:hypothetical protein